MSEALRIDGSTPDSTSCIAFYIKSLASRELNLERDILICTRNFVFGCNLVGEEEERVQTRMSRLGGCLAWGGGTLTTSFLQRGSLRDLTHSRAIHPYYTPKSYQRPGHIPQIFVYPQPCNPPKIKVMGIKAYPTTSSSAISPPALEPTAEFQLLSFPNWFP